MTDNTQAELRDRITKKVAASYGVAKDETIADIMAMVRDWHNKQIVGAVTANQLLNHIADGMPYDETFTFGELESALSAIETERNKLKNT